MCDTVAFQLFRLFRGNVMKCEVLSWWRGMVCTGRAELPRKEGGGGRMAAVGMTQERGSSGGNESAGTWIREAASSI